MALVCLGAFFYSDAKAWNIDAHKAIEKNTSLQFEHVKESLNRMEQDLSEIKCDVKEIAKEQKK